MFTNLLSQIGLPTLTADNSALFVIVPALTFILLLLTGFIVFRQYTAGVRLQLKDYSNQVSSLREGQEEYLKAQQEEAERNKEELEKLRLKADKDFIDFVEQGRDLSNARNDIEDLKRDSLKKDDEIKYLTKDLDDTKEKLRITTKTLEDFKEATAEERQIAKVNLQEATERYEAEKKRADELEHTIEGLRAELTQARMIIDTQTSDIAGLRDSNQKLAQRVQEQDITITNQTGVIMTLRDSVRRLEIDRSIYELGKNEQPLPQTKPIADESDKGTS